MTANPPTTTATATTAGTYRTVLLYTTGTERLNILTIYIHLYWPLFACSIWVIVSGTLSSFFIPAILLLLFHSQKFKYKTLCLKIIKKGQSTVSKKNVNGINPPPPHRSNQIPISPPPPPVGIGLRAIFTTDVYSSWCIVVVVVVIFFPIS